MKKIFFIFINHSNQSFKIIIYCIESRNKQKERYKDMYGDRKKFVEELMKREQEYLDKLMKKGKEEKEQEEEKRESEIDTAYCII